MKQQKLLSLKEKLEVIRSEHPSIRGSLTWPCAVGQRIAEAVREVMGEDVSATDETVLEALSWFVNRPGVYCIFYFNKDTWLPCRYLPAPALERGTGKWDIAVLSCGEIVRKWKGQ